eukprot:COSAG06_NODE_38764_length_421_cov_0.641745_1_plen_43_part_01
MANESRTVEPWRARGQRERIRLSSRREHIRHIHPGTEEKNRGH